MYGHNPYGTHAYSDNNTEDNDIENTKPDLHKYLPDWMRLGFNVRKLLELIADQLGILGAFIIETRMQKSIDHATWGLVDWEKDFGLMSESSLSSNRRREIVKAKLIGAGTTTNEMVVRTAAAFSGGEVDVVEYAAESRVEIVFIGVKGIPPNMAAFIRMLEDIKPAHLTYSFRYTYSIWDDIKYLKWAATKMKTWGELRVYEE
ncbi:DUF2313 domain-containing protein [Paenibacillus sp. GSMTC-2017]|uniref:putative phage tail protein n=1 Tax=Paenibacillus sp. GSMTC-2017 TaxID=2794350 RepID=UPI0018D9B5C1|nr:putative phage tail protein [Paenibacillus sp. GSMTC-2017]MBH5316693.1 DUF2313 domain-containing protein [Paenibacillus sp. GSMTC-2017]